MQNLLDNKTLLPSAAAATKVKSSRVVQGLAFVPWRLTPIEAFFIVESDFDPSGQAFNVGQKATKASPENVQLDHFIQGPYASFQFQIEYAKHDKRTFEVFTTSRLDIPLHGLLSSHQDRHLAFYGNVAVLQRNTSRNESLTYQNLSSESGNEVLATLLRYGYTGPAREIQAHSADRGAGTPVTSTVDASTQTDLLLTTDNIQAANSMDPS